MPVYHAPVDGDAPLGADRLTGDPSNYHFHYRGDSVYVASNNPLNVYEDLADERDDVYELTSGERYETYTDEDGNEHTVALYPTPDERAEDSDVEPFDGYTKPAE